MCWRVDRRQFQRVGRSDDRFGLDHSSTIRRVICAFVEQGLAAAAAAARRLAWTAPVMLCRPGCPRTTCDRVLRFLDFRSF